MDLVFLFFISPPPKWFLWWNVRMTQTDAGTIRNAMRAPYAIGGCAVEFATVESKAPDGEYHCWLCPKWIIHAYQTDSSSKLPASDRVRKKR